MINRENGLLEIYERIKAKRIELGLTSFKRTPTNPIKEPDMPCVFMMEGIDNIVKHSSRGNTGYPCTRALEVELEIVVNKSVDIMALYRQLRSVVFTSRDGSGMKNARLSDGTSIRENRTEGPTGYGLPDVKGMSLFLDMIYTDNDL